MRRPANQLQILGREDVLVDLVRTNDEKTPIGLSSAGTKPRSQSFCLVEDENYISGIDGTASLTKTN